MLSPLAPHLALSVGTNGREILAELGARHLHGTHLTLSRPRTIHKMATSTGHFFDFLVTSGLAGMRTVTACGALFNSQEACNGKREECDGSSSKSPVIPEKGSAGGGAATIGAGFIGGKSFAFAQERSERPTKGDIAILRFLNALEQIEADLWLQYAELGGVQDSTIPGANGGNPLYVGALEILDGDMAQYIVDNTDDEISHAAFLKAYLESKGADAVDLSRFATIPGSTAQGSSKKLRLTNLTQLTVDTSFWSRYRSITNPDFDRGAPFVSSAEPECGAAHGDSSNGCGHGWKFAEQRQHAEHHSALASDRVHGGFPLRVYRAGRHQPLPNTCSAGKQCGSLASFAEHRAERDDALSDLAGQGGQCASGFRHGQRAGRNGGKGDIFGSICSAGRNEPGIPEGGYLAGQPHHARTDPLPRQRLPARRDHSPDLFRTGGRGSFV